MMSTSMIAIISRLVATGRSMKMRDGFTAPSWGRSLLRWSAPAATAAGAARARRRGGALALAVGALALAVGADAAPWRAAHAAAAGGLASPGGPTAATRL